MKYEKPQLLALTPAISAIEDVNIEKTTATDEDFQHKDLVVGCYEDNE